MKRSSRLPQDFKLSVPLLLFCLVISLTGCDFSARWDLKRAEKALKAADKANAEFWAEPEYRKAQKYLVIAMDEARERNINAARDATHTACATCISVNFTPSQAIRSMFGVLISGDPKHPAS